MLKCNQSEYCLILGCPHKGEHTNEECLKFCNDLEVNSYVKDVCPFTIVTCE